MQESFYGAAEVLVPTAKSQSYRNLCSTSFSVTLRTDMMHHPAPGSLNSGEFYLGQVQLRILFCT